MLPMDLDITRSVRSYMDKCLDTPGISLERIHAGLRDAIWYSPQDRRALRAICDRHPREFTRWLYESERTGRYTGLIMVWPASYATAIHDHAGLWGIEMVLQGSLCVDDYELVEDAPGVAQPHFVRSSLLDVGDSCAFLGTQGHAHRCVNPSPQRPAITLHIYGGALDSYHSFETLHDGGYRAVPTHARIDGSIGVAAS